MDTEHARAFWQIAGSFPENKEGVYLQHAFAHEFDAQAAIRELPDGRKMSGKVLEYGCGGGSDTMSLIRRGADVFYVDIVPQNVALTRTRIDAMREKGRLGEAPVYAAADTAHGVVLAQSDDLPFHDDCFDSINCHGVLHHIPEEMMHRVIDAMFRVLRPGGHLYAMLYTEHLFNRCLPTIKNLVRNGWREDRAFGYMTDGGNDEHWCIARYYTEAAGRTLFEGHGFEIVRVHEYNNGDFRTTVSRKPGT